MTITYKWHIVSLDYETKDGYVFTAHWTLEAADSEDPSLVSSTYGAVNLERPNSLIPYKNLTESTVIGWVKEELRKTSQLQQVEEYLTKQISEMRSPSSKTGVPWPTAE